MSRSNSWQLRRNVSILTAPSGMPCSQPRDNLIASREQGDNRKTEVGPRARVQVVNPRSRPRAPGPSPAPPGLALQAGGVLSLPANRLARPQVQSFLPVVDRQAVALFQGVRRAFGRDL